MPKAFFTYLGILVAWGLLAVCRLGAEVPSKPVGLNSLVVSGFLENHCYRCHGPAKQKGKPQQRYDRRRA